jgi:hypothetical protein
VHVHQSYPVPPPLEFKKIGASPEEYYDVTVWGALKQLLSLGPDGFEPYELVAFCGLLQKHSSTEASNPFCFLKQMYVQSSISPDEIGDELLDPPTDPTPPLPSSPHVPPPTNKQPAGPSKMPGRSGSQPSRPTPKPRYLRHPLDIPLQPHQGPEVALDDDDEVDGRGSSQRDTDPNQQQDSDDDFEHDEWRSPVIKKSKGWQQVESEESESENDSAMTGRADKAESEAETAGKVGESSADEGPVAEGDGEKGGAVTLAKAGSTVAAEKPQAEGGDVTTGKAESTAAAQEPEGGNDGGAAGKEDTLGGGSDAKGGGKVQKKREGAWAKRGRWHNAGAPRSARGGPEKAEKYVMALESEAESESETAGKPGKPGKPVAGKESEAKSDSGTMGKDAAGGELDADGGGKVDKKKREGPLAKTGRQPSVAALRRSDRGLGDGASSSSTEAPGPRRSKRSREDDNVEEPKRKLRRRN